MATTTNYGWTTPDDTALVKDGASAIRTLGSSVDTTTKALNPSTTLGDIEYRSSTANTNTRLGIGSSGQGLQVVAGVPSWAASSTSTLTTTGDLLYASAANTLARRGIGSTGQVLTVSGGVPSWATPAAGGGMTLISETVASASTGITFSSLGSYKQLLLMWSGLSHSTTGSAFSLRFNNSSASVYNSIGFQGTATTFNAGESGLTHVGGFQTALMYSFGTEATTVQSAGIGGSILIDNYTSSTKSKTCSVQYGYYDTTNNRYQNQITTMNFTDTTAITSLDIVRLSGSATLSNNGNSTIRLYGIS
jgi:hypothetical protein